MSQNPCHMSHVTCHMHGYTLIEMLIASAVVIILAVIIFAGLTSFRESNNLLRGVDLVADTLNKARVQTLASKEQSGYGIRLASTSVIFFKGNGYNPSDSSNETINMPPMVEINNFANSSTSLNIVFKRLSGETDNPGTIKMIIKRNSDKTKSIEVYNSGLVEIK
ncbi:MAG: hypothetical protein UV01_C0015G0025 [Parcubacteria group bacterium GW2011_GWA2_42_14]|nr:MAG: hypothetical protein UV01_C0015G0025 [Parcubacteria group bacterium GW2011_GWA2_42_14]